MNTYSILPIKVTVKIRRPFGTSLSFLGVAVFFLPKSNRGACQKSDDAHRPVDLEFYTVHCRWGLRKTLEPDLPVPYAFGSNLPVKPM